MSAEATPVLMPKIGQAMEEGTIVRWERAEGDVVQAGDVILTIETDKSTYELEATATGPLHIAVAEGEEVPIHTVIGYIGDAPPTGARAEAPAAAAAAAAGAAGAGADAPARGGGPSSRAGGRVLASPKAKRLAAELGVDLASVTATGADGVVSAQDVEAAAAAGASGDGPAGVPATGRRVLEERPLKGIRKTAAHRLQQAWQTIPHIVQMVDVDATGLLAERRARQAEVPAVSVNDLLIDVAARALAGMPELNATVSGDTLLLHDGVDVGLAVDTPNGLVVAVVRGADQRGLDGIVAERERLVQAARERRLGPGDVGDASVTISNLGGYGVKAGTPVINLGEPVLAFVGAIEDRPVAVDGQVVVRPTMTLSVAYDHRVADGVAASRYTRALKEGIESLGGDRAAAPAAPAGKATPAAEEGTGGPAVRRATSTAAGDSHAVRVRSGRHEWTLDEPEEDGGTDTGPDPVTALLGALCGCMTIALQFAARRRKVPVERIAASAETAVGLVKSIDLRIEVWSTAPEEQVRALLEPAHRSCRVSRALSPDIPVSTDLVVHRS